MTDFVEIRLKSFSVSLDKINIFWNICVNSSRFSASESPRGHTGQDVLIRDLVTSGSADQRATAITLATVNRVLKFWKKIEILKKKWNFEKKLKFWKKIEILKKNWNFEKKIWNFEKKFEILKKKFEILKKKIEILKKKFEILNFWKQIWTLETNIWNLDKKFEILKTFLKKNLKKKIV